MKPILEMSKCLGLCVRSENTSTCLVAATLQEPFRAVALAAGKKGARDLGQGCQQQSNQWNKCGK
jgi:hypothetical protein